MAKKKDRRGEQYGPFLILDETDRNKWLCECIYCKRKYIKVVQALRVARNSGIKRCTQCADRSKNTSEEVKPDIGVIWLPTGGFTSTELGLLQQDFIYKRLKFTLE